MTPPKLTLSNLATGVIEPVLPTWKSISLIKVIAFSAENLRAIDHRGFFPTTPSLFWSDKLFNFTTSPSISYSRALLLLFISW